MDNSKENLGIVLVTRKFHLFHQCNIGINNSCVSIFYHSFLGIIEIYNLALNVHHTFTYMTKISFFLQALILCIMQCK